MAFKTSSKHVMSFGLHSAFRARNVISVGLARGLRRSVPTRVAVPEGRWDDGHQKSVSEVRVRECEREIWVGEVNGRYDWGMYPI